MVALRSATPPSPAARFAHRSADRAATVALDAAYDAGLIRRFNAGDETAFAEIVLRHRGKMFALALAMLRDPGDAEEIAQDTFIRAHRHLARFRGDSSLSTWLHCIVTNLSRNRYWYFFRRQRHATCSLDSPLGPDSTATVADLVPSDASDPAREAAAQEFSAHALACMAKLAKPQRRILALRNLSGRSYAEIGVLLAINPGTVKSRIARARQTLRGLLAQTYAEGERPPSPSSPWFETSRPAGRLRTAGR